MLKFEWNEIKAESNLSKHGINFEDCVSAFNDESRLFVYDEKHSQKENRYILIGKNKMNKVVVISYTIRNYKYRLISCRLANKKERKKYEEK